MGFLGEKHFAVRNFKLAVLLTVFLQLGTIDSYGQTADTMRIKIEDGWIESMTNKMGIDLSLNNAYEVFEVRTVANTFIISPNVSNNLRLRLNYDFISVGFKMAPEFVPGNGDRDTKGTTRSFELNTSLIFRRFFIDLSYARVKGYFLQNTGDYIPWESGEPYIQFPDLYYNGFAISSGYINNPKFSLRSLFSHTERQLRSAGTFIPAFDFRYFTIDDRSGGASTQKTNNIEMSVGPGYAYTFVAKEKFYCSAGLSGSVGYLHTKLTTRFPTEDVITSQDNLILRWDVKTGIGYNGSKFFTGLYTNVSGTAYRQERTTVRNFETRIFYHLFVGMRFQAPDYLKRTVAGISKRISKK